MVMLGGSRNGNHGVIARTTITTSTMGQARPRVSTRQSPPLRKAQPSQVRRLRYHQVHETGKNTLNPSLLLTASSLHRTRRPFPSIRLLPRPRFRPLMLGLLFMLLRRLLLCLYPPGFFLVLCLRRPIPVRQHLRRKIALILPLPVLLMRLLRVLRLQFLHEMKTRP